MKSTNKSIEYLGFIIIIVLAVSLQGAPSFTAGPTATLQNNVVNISFTISEPIDVEVAIIDANGKVVKHLAAGVLGGEYNPPPPLQPGLSQSLTWDIKDDYGNALQDGSYKVRVRLGVKPVWKYFIDTKVIPGTHNAQHYVPRSWEKTILRTHPIFNRIRDEINPKLNLTVNDPYEQVYIRVHNGNYITKHVFNGYTGQPVDTMQTILNRTAPFQWMYWGEIAFSWDGEVFYHTTTAHSILRYTRKGIPSYWPQEPGVTGRIGKLDTFYLSHTHSRGHALGPKNYLYMLHHEQPPESIHNNEYSVWQSGTVSKIDSFGSHIQRDFITIHTMSSGIRVDLQGNIYVGARVKPRNVLVPEYVDSAIVPGDTAWDGLRWWAEEMYGSLLKFQPTGGGLFKASQGSLEGGKDIPVPGVSRFPLRAEGLVWAYYGINPVTTHYGHRRSDAMKFPTRGAICLCNVQRFDVDRYGRIFMPDPFMLSIKAIDNSRNHIFIFDHVDMTTMLNDMGKLAEARLLGWPHVVEATDNAIYVADQINNQVVCFSLDADVTDTVQAPIVIENGQVPDMSAGFFLYRNSPNPFRAGTRIRYRLSGNALQQVKLMIYDISSRLVRQLVHRSQEPGSYTVAWDGRDSQGRKVGSGLYLCRLVCKGAVKEYRMILLK